MISLTHFGHACVLAELEDGPRILFDPGTYSTGFEDLTGLDAILITHEHHDHLDPARLADLIKANPGAQVVTVDGGAFDVAVLAGDHALVHPDVPVVRNNAYQVGDVLFHPGDSFTMPSGPVKVLLLPTGGPWMKAGEAVDYLRAVAPEIAIPIHQAGLAQAHQQLHYGLFHQLAAADTTVRVLDHGTSASF
jgi:L-ascorbate metabolism protein UlaG (beta-lactamase superfamily)